MSDSALKAALLLLSSLWPGGLDLATLRERVVGIVERNGLPAPRPNDLDDLGRCALELFCAGQADLRLTRLAPSVDVSVRPRAHALARHEASVRNTVTTRNHVSLPLDEVGRATVAALDGTRTMDEIVDAVARASASETTIERDEIVGRIGAAMQMLNALGNRGVTG